MSTLEKEEDDSSSTLAIWCDKCLPHADLMRYFLLLGYIFSNVEDLEKVCEDDEITHDSDHIRHSILISDLKHYVILINNREIYEGLSMDYVSSRF